MRKRPVIENVSEQFSLIWLFRTKVLLHNSELWIHFNTNLCPGALKWHKLLGRTHRMRSIWYSNSNQFYTSLNQWHSLSLFLVHIMYSAYWIYLENPKRQTMATVRIAVFLATFHIALGILNPCEYDYLPYFRSFIELNIL